MLEVIMKLWITAAFLIFGAWRAAKKEKDKKVELLPFAKEFIKTGLYEVWNGLKKFRETIRSPFPKVESEEE